MVRLPGEVLIITHSNTSDISSDRLSIICVLRRLTVHFPVSSRANLPAIVAGDTPSRATSDRLRSNFKKNIIKRGNIKEGKSG